MKTLIIDDDIEICKRLQLEAKKEGCSVEYTTSPVDIMERLLNAETEREPYELIFIDIRTPKVNGFEIFKEIREAGLDLDVIIVAGYGDQDEAIEAIQLGAIDYLRKPISLEELRTALFRVRQKRRADKGKTLKYRILVVDDEKDLCGRVKRELDKEGYDVEVAYDGIEGLDYFNNNHVDVVVTDLRMPRMDGLEMLEKCREIKPDFVSIVITAFGDYEKAITSLRLDVFNYLKKPLLLEELLGSVKKGIDMLLLRRSLSARNRELEIETALKTRYVEKIECEKRFTENIIATIPDSLLILDKDLRIKSANRSFYKAFQLDIEPKKAIGSSVTEILHDKGGRLSAELTKLFGTEAMLENFELCYKSEKLGERIFDITARGLIIAEEEEEEEALVVVRDRTVRKRAEAALAASKAYTESIIENFLDTLIVADTEAKIQTVNPVTCHLLGYTEEELIGQPIGLIFAEEEEEEALRVFQFFRETEKAEALGPQDTIRNRELTYKTKDGRLIPMSFNASVMTDEAGNVTGVVAGAKDITDLKSAEAEIRKEKTFSENIIATVPDSLLVIDRDLRIKSANRSFYKAFQLDIEPKKAIGSSVTEILHDKGGRLSAELTKLFGTEAMLENFELCYKSEKLGGRVFNITARGIIIAEEEEEEEALVVIRDRTARKQAEESAKKKALELEAAYKELRKTQAKLIQTGKMAAMGTLGAGIAHQLNQPLAGIRGFTQTILMQTDKNNPFYEDLKEIEEQTGYMRDIIHNVSGFARQSEFRKEPVDINEPVDKALDLLSEQLRLHGIKLIKSLKPDLPRVNANFNQMQQVFINFIVNAREALDGLPDDAGKELSISTRMRHEKDGESWIEIEFSDTGPGVHEDIKDRIYEPFFTTKEPSSTGLGLYLNYSIIHDHGGYIELVSEEGRGASFIVKLPSLGFRQ